MIKPILFSTAILLLVSCGSNNKPEPLPQPTLVEEPATKPDSSAVITDSLPVGSTAEPIKTPTEQTPMGTKSSTAKPGKPTLHGSWQLEKVYGAKEPFKMLFPNKKPTVTFDLRTNTLNGNNGCNQYNGPFTLRNGVLTISDMMATKMFCEGVKEQLYMTTLQMANGYKFEDQTLVLTLDNEGLLAFSPIK